MDSTDGANTERPILAAATNAVATRFGLFASPSNATNKPAFGGRQLDSDPAYIGVVSATSRSLQWVMSLGTVDYIARTEELFINGASDSAGSGLFTGSANTSNTDSVRVRLGAGLGAVTITKLDGKIAMVASGVGSIPSAGEIDKIFGYLAHHFGLAASLPSGHPYKSAPPTV